jgi:hypothetical protein
LITQIFIILKVTLHEYLLTKDDKENCKYTSNRIVVKSLRKTSLLIIINKPLKKHYHTTQTSPSYYSNIEILLRLTLTTLPFNTTESLLSVNVFTIILRNI